MAHVSPVFSYASTYSVMLCCKVTPFAHDCTHPIYARRAPPPADHIHNDLHSPTGTRNDESGWDPMLQGRGRDPAAAPQGNRLTVHTVRDMRGRVLGLGSSSQVGGGGDDADGGAEGGGWEPVVEAWASHEAAVTGVDIASGFGNLGGVSGVVTSGGDG